MTGESLSVSRVGRDERARLHEVASTLAGVRAATTLLNAPGGIVEERRAVIAEMVLSELQRLERMVQERQDVVRSERDPLAWMRADRPADQVGEVIDLDAVVGTLVLAHQVRGTEIEWSPSRMLALGDSDHMAEALNVLLDNATTHGAGPVRVTVNAAGSTSTAVEIAVADSGPGVPPELRRRIFAWGVSGPASDGQGIGLHTARDLMERQGGYLELVESGEATTFVIGIPMLGCTGERADQGAQDDTGESETPAQGGSSGVAA